MLRDDGMRAFLDVDHSRDVCRREGFSEEREKSWTRGRCDAPAFCVVAKSEKSLWREALLWRLGHRHLPQSSRARVHRSG
jgi:hypothetical protein